jgi:hypothetical protein
MDELPPNRFRIATEVARRVGRGYKWKRTERDLTDVEVSALRLFAAAPAEIRGVMLESAATILIEHYQKVFESVAEYLDPATVSACQKEAAARVGAIVGTAERTGAGDNSATPGEPSSPST